MMQAIPIHTYVQGTIPCETTDTSHGRNKNVSLTRTHATSSELTKLEGNLMLARTDDNIKKKMLEKPPNPKTKLKGYNAHKYRMINTVQLGF